MIKQTITRYAKGIMDKKRMMADTKQKKIDENLQSMGYGGIEDFNAKNPQLKDVPSEDMMTSGIKKVVRGVKNVVKRYIK